MALVPWAEGSKTKFSTDWDDLGFKIIETKSMFKTVYDAKKEWAKGGLLPYEAINISPASSVLNYGQGVFEGMKATRTRNGDVVLFRPEMNAKRIRKSARRLCIPPIDETFFLNLMSIFHLVARFEDAEASYDNALLIAGQTAG